MAVYNRPQSDENEPLLPGSEPEQRSDVGKCTWWDWGPHPYWLLPIIVVSSLARGSTMSARVSVFTDVACRALSSATDCSNAPEVQARAARIQATVTTVTSVLSTVLTGPLSRWGDIHGRKPLLLFTLSGGLAMEFVFILVTREGSVFYNYAEPFTVLGSVFDGVVGGLSTFNGVIHAYTSDCTQHGSRAKIFSTLSGMMFVGLACGSWLGGMVLKLRPDLSPYALFFGSVALLALIEVYILVMVPESNPKVISKSAEEPSVETSPRSIRNVATFFKSGLKHLIVGLVTPISMFIPRRVGNSTRRDWNLTFVGGALFLYLVSIGVYQIKYLYGKHVYAWKAEQARFITRTIDIWPNGFYGL
ncbi:hypothetical protein VNI00_005043 [Paramarasmius palmivorus]|uniref:Proton-coupled folate transporter n=1 Tax=Paramarasmius palmivorus TaxID=297713 RepID=A0AAW0DEG6_9AGAR